MEILDLMVLDDDEIPCVATMLRVAQIAIREAAAEYPGEIDQQAGKLGVPLPDMQHLVGSGKVCAKLQIFANEKRPS